jgi:hypothetical protein
VRDGILGKLIYSAIVISGFVVMARSQNIFFGPSSAGLTLHVSLALAGPACLHGHVLAAG